MSGGRRITKRRSAVLGFVATLVVLSTTLVGTAFGQDSSSPSTAASGPTTFTYADVAEPSGLNVLDGYLGTDYTFWAMNYDLPINFSAADYKPDYAHSIVTSVDTSSDSMTFTYHVRSGMKWSDGQPFTAKDVAWTLDFYKKNNSFNFSADLALMADNGAKALNDTTFTITSTTPTLAYSGNSVWLYEYILPQHIWSKYENDYKAAKAVTNAPSVGSGPYIIKSYVKGTSVELDRNPYYWGNAVGLHPQVDRVIYQIFGSQDAEAAALQNGSIDFGYFSSANTLNTLKQRGLETRGAIVPAFDEIGINTGSAYQTDTTGGFSKHGDGAQALTDPILREAMRKAVDSQALINSVLKGYGSVAISPVLDPPLSTAQAFSPGPTDPDLSFNIAAANTMLDNAGYKMGPDGIRIDPKTNKPLEFRIFSRSSDQNSQDIVPFVQAWMKQIGIKLDPTTLTSGKLGNVILAGNYDLFVWGWYPNPDPNYILNIFTCQQRPPDANTYRNSDSYYCNPEYDKLYQQQLTATSQSARDVAIKAEQEMIYHDQPYLILWSAATLEAWSPKWTGFVSQPSGPTGDVLATYGPFSFINLRPGLATAGSSGSSKGLSPGIIIAIIAALVVIGAVVVLMRRKDADDEA